MSLTGIKDTDREVLKHVDDKELLRICTINKKTWNEVCDDGFLRRRLLNKYPGIEKYKSVNESWKRFFLSAIYYISKLKEDYQFVYTSGDFENQYWLFKNKKSDLLFLYAASDDEWSIIKYLIDKGYSVHLYQNYALRKAAKAGDLEMVKWLVEHGADIHANDNDALIAASEDGHLDVVKYLVEHGADIHAEGDKAVKAAVEDGHFEVVKYLVEQGANIRVDDNLPLRIAQQYGFKEISEYLRSKINELKNGN